MNDVHRSVWPRFESGEIFNTENGFQKLFPLFTSFTSNQLAINLPSNGGKSSSINREQFFIKQTPLADATWSSI